MAYKRKDQLTVSGEWAKHLRKFFRRQFWKRERKAGKDLIRKERQYHIYFFFLVLICFGFNVSIAQLKVAQYSYGKYGNAPYWKFLEPLFWRFESFGGTRLLKPLIFY